MASCRLWGRGLLPDLRTQVGGVSAGHRTASGKDYAGQKNKQHEQDDSNRRGCTMSAMVMVLPRVWATQATSFEVCAGLQQQVEGGRKGPQSLRLVHAEQQAQPQSRLRVVPELGFYRKYTEGMLRRYSRLSMESGRVPSLLGQEMFRGKVTSYSVHSFDDVVIFVHDMEQSLKKLSPGQQHLIRRIAVEQYSQGEAAAMLGLTLRTVVRRYAEAIDRLTRILLERKMLEPLEECRG